MNRTTKFRQLSLPGSFLAAFLALTVLTQAAPSTDAQVRVRGRIFNVKSYGAKGDAKTIDTSAIRAAISAANRVPGSTVLFPEGNYLFDNDLSCNGIKFRGQNAGLMPITHDAYIELSGNNGSIADLEFKEAPFFPVPIIPPINQIVVNGAKNFSISGVKFNFSVDGPNVAIRHWCIRVENNSTSGKIFNNEMTRPGGIRILDSTLITVSQNNIKGNDLPTIPPILRTVGVLSEKNRNVKIINNKIFSPSSQVRGVGVATDGDFLSDVVNNTITDFTAGIVEKNSTRIKIEQNVLDCGVSTVGITFTDGAIDLHNTRFAQVNQNTVKRCARDAIRCDDGQSNLNISGNVLTDAGLEVDGGVESSVIFVDCPDAQIGIVNNRYSGNTKNLKYFIECEQPSPQARVSGNTTTTSLPNRIGP